MAFVVADMASTVEELESNGIMVEPIRIDPITGNRYTFFADPDGLPLELVENAG
ncbi:putative lyase [compost metagenome]